MTFRSVPANLLVLLCCTALLGGCGATPSASGEPPASAGASLTSAGTSAAPGDSAPGSSQPASGGLGGAEAWTIVDLAEPTVVTTAPSYQPGYHCSPCHPAAASQLFGVGPVSGGVIAVGVQQPPAEAIALSSPDGRQWTDVPGFTGGAGTAAVAVASSGSRTVIVGHDPNGAMAWASDGATWQPAARQPSLLVPNGGGAMTSVAAFGNGFVAGGYRDDPLHAKAAAAVWRSDDGLTWQLDNAAGPFAGGRIWGVATKGNVIVAVGTSGDPIYGPAAAWRWTAATGWQRARIGPDNGGVMLAVAATATGFVAVGQNGHDDGALAWTSANGFAWTAEPDQPAFHHFSSPVRMQSVASTQGGGLIAGGWRSDAGNGSGVTWISSDGFTWQQPTWVSSFSGGQITGVAVVGGASVAVGRTGYPDNNQATIWVGAAP